MAFSPKYESVYAQSDQDRIQFRQSILRLNMGRAATYFTWF